MYLAKEEIQALKTKQVQIDCIVGRTEKQAFNKCQPILVQGLRRDFWNK